VLQQFFLQKEKLNSDVVFVMHVLVQIVKQLVRLCSYVFRFEKNLNYVSKSLTCAFNSVLELVNSCVSGKISRIVPGYVRTIFDRGHL